MAGSITSVFPSGSEITFDLDFSEGFHSAQAVISTFVGDGFVRDVWECPSTDPLDIIRLMRDYPLIDSTPEVSDFPSGSELNLPALPDGVPF